MQTITFDNVGIYEGEVEDNVPTGRGQVTYSNGFTFTGTFKNGEAQFGIMRDSDNVELKGFHAITYLNQCVY